MKRYLLFEGAPYEPSGGWGDWVGDFDSTEEAKAASETCKYPGLWAEIVDCETKRVILAYSERWEPGSPKAEPGSAIVREWRSEGEAA